MSRFSQVSQRVIAMAKQGYLPTVHDANGLIPASEQLLCSL